MMDSEYFSPYRPDGKLVITLASDLMQYLADRSPQYGFVCVVTGATQPVGKAITLELAGMD